MHGIIPYIHSTRRQFMPAAAHRPTPDREIKRERIELRVSASAKELIQQAIAVTGLTAGDLAYEGARRVLDEHERMLLTGSDRDAFLAALASPPEPSERLVAAMRRHRDLVG
jgi:uncharacterized protein (DUF1778 family)